MKEEKTRYHKDFKLRYAILCNSNVMQQWQINCLHELHQLDFVEPVLLVLPQEEKPIRTSFFKKVFSYPYRLFLYRLSKRWFTHPLQQTAPLPTYLQMVPQWRCSVLLKGKHSQYFALEDIQQIKSYQPHFIIRFGFNIIRGEILNCTPYGVWSYHHGNEEEFRGGPPAFWEVYQGKKVVGAILQKLTDKLDGGIILKKGCFNTTPYSVRETLTRVYDLSASWMKQVCLDLNHQQAAYFALPASSTQAKVYTFPGNAVMLAYAVKKLMRKWRFHWNDLFQPETWQIGLVKLNGEYKPESQLPLQMDWIKHPERNSYFADPFIHEDKGMVYLLMEEYSYETQQGSICLMDLSTGKRTTLIHEAFHLSYPFTFEHANEIYVLPEAAESNHLTLYRVSLTQSKVLSKTTILEGVQAYDPTLLHYKNKWWLFVTQKNTDSNTGLHIYYANALTGPYIPHANNPVKVDVASSRPAGAVLQFNNTLYRPAQNSTLTYGGSIVLNKIKVLNEVHFEEEFFDTILPLKNFPYQNGLHTLNASGNYLVIDVKKWMYNGANFKSKIRKKLRMRS